MKVHVLSNPHRATTSVYADADPFAIIVHKYINNLKHKYEFIHYGLEGSDVDCEHHSLPKDLENFNKQASSIISKRKSPEDIILCFYGADNRDATIDHQDLKIVEPVIGYTPSAIFAPYRVFESYSHMTYYYGTKGMLMSPSWWDDVIPSGKDPKDFKYNEKKKDYFLMFGRVCPEKGLHVAIQATEAAGVDLVLAGPGNLSECGYSTTPKHVTCVGVCDAKKRKSLMSDAKGIIGATYYLEPFGNMIVEGYFSGTPAITTDWGAFTETVVNGVTGYRCREFSEFVYAINNIGSISSKTCYDYAMNNYTHDVIYDKHDKYLQKIAAGDFYRSLK
jgi:glycosyltransferase involved in cell wall biosynthesis